MAGPDHPSIAEVEAIGAWPHPVLRNLRITQAYHELSVATARAVGPGANWCAFATWASKQAGQSIRAEDLDAKIEAAFATSEAVRLAIHGLRDLRRAVGQAVDESAVLTALRDALGPLLAVERVADAVARGNKKVFDEIGREFARFLHVVAGGDPGVAAVEDLVQGLRLGEPPEGQGLLAAAFRDYHRAMGTADAGARAQRLLLANLRIGLHEQTRLQPEIAEALNAPVLDPAAVRRRLVETLFPRVARVRVPIGLLDEISARLVERVRAVVRRVVTEELMTLALPGQILHLGQDLAGPFPAHLAILTAPDLVAFLAPIDPTPDALRGSGAADWADLSDRIHFIADLFRSQHENPALLDPPFTPEQLRAIAEGRTPGGAL